MIPNSSIRKKEIENFEQEFGAKNELWLRMYEIVEKMINNFISDSYSLWEREGEREREREREREEERGRERERLTHSITHWKY